MIRRIGSLTTLLFLCLSLAACGGGGSESTAPASTGETESSTEASLESTASTEAAETGSTAAESSERETTAPASTAESTLAESAAESESAAQEEPASVPVLIRSGSFTGTTPLETNNQYHGGYYYSEQTEDGQTIILNCCFTSTWEGEDLEDYMAACAAQISEAEIQDLTITESAEHTQRISYPVHLLSWQTGQGEEARQWDAFFFMTDTHTYLYAFDTAADAAPEMQEVWQEVFGQLSLVDLTA